MKKISMSDGWKFQKEGSEETKIISVPHDAMIFEERSIDNVGRKNTAWFSGADYLYEKSYFFGDEYKDKVVYLEFEGVYHNSEVYLNGEKLSFRPYGYTNFYVRIDEHIILNKENIIKVRAVNSDQPNSRWYTGSGIHRPVSMLVFPKEHVLLNSIKVTTISSESRMVNINLKTSVSGKVTLSFLDNKKVIKKIDLDSNGEINENIELTDTQLWSGDNPKLYTLKVNFKNHEESVRFGIRSINITRDNGLLINGERVILKGACIHHDNGLLGAVSHPFAEYRKIKILKENGYNAIRSAHNPSSKALLDACDELGMLVLDEYVDMWYIHKTKYDYASYFENWWKQDLKDMIDKDYNHPSVIMYSIGNEVAETGQKKGIALTKEMNDYIKTMDQTRPVTCGINVFFNYLYSLGFGVYSDSKAEKAMKSTKKAKSVGSEFFNDVAGLLGDKTMKIGAWLPGSNKKTKGAFANLDVAGYNYGILRYKKDLKKYPERLILGTETFCKDAFGFWDMAKKNNGIIGDFVWAGMDYLGEVAIGSWVHDDHAPEFTGGPGWMTAGSGRIDINGIANAEMAFTRVAFELDQIRMAVVPVNNHGKKHSPSAWKLSKAMESWSWNGHDGDKTTVEVYTRAHNIVLFVNNKKVGSKKSNKKGLTKFKVRYHDGSITAIGFDKNKKELYRTTLHTASEENKLMLAPEDKVITQDQLAYVQLKLTDEKGNLKPLLREKINIEVENGELIGLGHACPYNEDGYKNTYTETYMGQALAIIKPVNKGKIVVKGECSLGTSLAEVEVK